LAWWALPARASGVAFDTRASLPGRLHTVHPANVLVETSGDCWARLTLRMREIDESVRWIREVLEAPEANLAQANIAALGKLKLRSVSAGGCNGCELEVNALTNVNFDIGRYGIDIVASPRHADGLVLTGPITRNMAQALQLCWDAMPEPKLVIAVGACAISGSPFAGSTALDRAFLDRFAPTLYVPGCPPHPLTFVRGVLDLLGISS